VHLLAEIVATELYFTEWIIYKKKMKTCKYKSLCEIYLVVIKSQEVMFTTL